VDELEKDSFNPQESKFVSLLQEELKAMEVRRIVDSKRNDPIYKTLELFIEKTSESPFEEVYEQLSDPEKYAIITRLENRKAAQKGFSPDTQSDEVNDFIKEQRRALGIDKIVESHGKMREIADVNRMAELRAGLNV
jgi:hypothetical protein